MPNRTRNYMDRLFGRNEDQRFYDERFNDKFGSDREDRYGRDHDFRQDHYERLQSSRTRPGNGRYMSDYERDYNVRRNPPTGDDYRAHRSNTSGFDYNLRDNESFHNRGFDSNPGMKRDRGFFGKGPKGWKRSDERIKEEVSESLYRDYHVDASDIEIEVKDGIVTLSGTVDSREAKRSAEECIENLSGVSDVHNRIRVADKSNASNLRTGSDSSNEKRSLS